GTDPATDVALLKIDGQGLPTIPFGDSDQLRLGEWVLAIGSPLGYQLRSTITAGIVSAKGRAMGGGAYENDPYGRLSGRSQLQIESFIQTDAAVNPGNSGGALVNKKGELVGINTAIVSQTGSYSGYSFASPSNIVRKVVGDLIDFGSVKRAVLGISMSEISEGLVTALNQDLPKSEQYSSLDDLMKKLKLSSLDGVYIREVVKGGAADKAGIQVGDVLTKIDGVEMANGGAVQEKVNSFHPGDKAKITIIRGGKEKNVEVTFQSSSSETGTEVAEGEIAFYGTTLKAASQEALEKFGLKNGVEIVSVSTGKMLEAGASEGFIITFVNDQPVSKPQDVVDIAKAARRSIYIEGITANGRKAYFGFGKD
ncbi:MAG: trypsin-like peptidase domain-containing protein, partial [Bacteroidota bacterium]|nr:trypsin-like peptidase domain-containing protein [Bacteroidota bacterium]